MLTRGRQPLARSGCPPWARVVWGMCWPRAPSAAWMNGRLAGPLDVAPRVIHQSDIGGARGARLVARGILLLGTGTLIDGLMEMPDWPAMIQIGLLGVPWRSAGSGTPSIAASIDCRHGCGVVLSALMAPMWLLSCSCSPAVAFPAPSASNGGHRLPLRLD